MGKCNHYGHENIELCSWIFEIRNWLWQEFWKNYNFPICALFRIKNFGCRRDAYSLSYLYFFRGLCLLCFEFVFRYMDYTKKRKICFEIWTFSYIFIQNSLFQRDYFSLKFATTIESTYSGIKYQKWFFFFKF